MNQQTSICIPPMPLGLDNDEVEEKRPVTPAVKLPLNPKQGEALLDDSEAQEQGRRQLDSNQKSPSHLYPPQQAATSTWHQLVRWSAQ